ncbi:MAG: hypothetical protein HQM00_08760 [Magnetococcales bacterium]|nr:hypothetical protein [Magnetococcales bacterium]
MDDEIAPVIPAVRGRMEIHGSLAKGEGRVKPSDPGIVPERDESIFLIFLDEGQGNCCSIALNTHGSLRIGLQKIRTTVFF